MIFVRPPLILVPLALIAGTAACRATPPEPATIAFKLDAPFCGSMRVERSIDGVVVARDILSSGTATPAVAISAGSHTVSGKALWLDARPGTLYTWPDTTYTLAEGEHVTRILPLYCS